MDEVGGHVFKLFAWQVLEQVGEGGGQGGRDKGKYMAGGGKPLLKKILMKTGKGRNKK